MRWTQTTEQRFWAKVNKTDGCWLWTAGLDNNGYGCFWHNGTMHKAPRISWLLTTGAEPGGAFVCHHCDTPACVRPDHLFLGTQRDNLRDMSSKGRRRAGVGERHRSAKLTESDVLKIRQMFTGHWATAADMASHHGITVRSVYDIVNRKTWRHVS